MRILIPVDVLDEETTEANDAAKMAVEYVEQGWFRHPSETPLYHSA